MKKEKYEKYYKICYTLGILILADTMLTGAGLPSLTTLVLIPVLDLIFNQNTTDYIIGVYTISWLFFFILAIILNRKIKKI